MTKTLTFDECKALFSMISTRGSMRSKTTDRALVTALLLCGGAARTWTWEDALSDVATLPAAVYVSLREMAMDKQIPIFPFNHAGFTAAHWVNEPKLGHAVFTVGRKPLTTQEVTRRIKRYGRMAGIAIETLNLRTLANTHVFLLDVFGDADAAAEALGLLKPTTTTHPTFRLAPSRDSRLHGINRRASVMASR